MTSQFILRNAVCGAALLAAPAALADVTAAEVWENWKANLSVYGAEGVSIGNEDIAGGTVTISDLVLTMEDPEANVTASIDSLVFTENGDGTVSVEMPESYPISIVNPDEGTEVDLLLSQENMNMVVSGTPEAMNYDLTADTYELRVAEIRGEEEFEGDMVMTAKGLSGSYQTDITDGMDTSFAFASSTIEVLVDAKEPGGEDYVVLSGQMADVVTDGTVQMPEGADLNDPDTFAGDFVFRSDTSFGQTGFIFDVDADGEAAKGSFQASSMAANANVAPEGLSYQTEMAGAALEVTAAAMPLPVRISLAELSNKFEMPTSATEEPAPFAYRLALLDLVVNDEIWAMGDPAGALPRDPASIVLDVSGMAKLFFDIMDPEQEAAMAQADMPGEIHSFAVNEILISAVGAEVTAAGEFTFDNTDLETFDGLPRPMGELNVNITGANALLDTLVSMGLLPQEQATMGRMMMGMFTQPAGDDALTSTVEINEEGHVLANGQRLK